MTEYNPFSAEELHELSQHALRPARHHQVLLQALSLCPQRVDEFWQLLLQHRVIPDDWSIDRLPVQRRFYVPRNAEVILPNIGSVEVLPAHKRQVVAFVSDVKGVLAAEQCARDVWVSDKRYPRYRSVPIALPDPASVIVVWKIAHHFQQEYIAPQSAKCAWAALELRSLIRERGIAERNASKIWTGRANDFTDPKWRLSRVVWAATVWRMAVHYDLVVPSHWWTYAGKRFSSLHDPYETELNIWKLGYGVERVSNQAVMLFCPLEKSHRT